MDLALPCAAHDAPACLQPSILAVRISLGLVSFLSSGATLHLVSEAKDHAHHLHGDVLLSRRDGVALSAAHGGMVASAMTASVEAVQGCACCLTAGSRQGSRSQCWRLEQRLAGPYL